MSDTAGAVVGPMGDWLSVHRQPGVGKLDTVSPTMDQGYYDISCL